MAELLPERELNEVVAHIPGVKRSLKRVGDEIATIANARLAPHKKTFPGAHIKVEQGVVDTYVSLVDPAALSIEFGHFLGREELGLRRRYIPGLHLFIDWYGD